MLKNFKLFRSHKEKKFDYWIPSFGGVLTTIPIFMLIIFLLNELTSYQKYQEAKSEIEQLKETISTLEKNALALANHTLDDLSPKDKCSTFKREHGLVDTTLPKIDSSFVIMGNTEPEYLDELIKNINFPYYEEKHINYLDDQNSLKFNLYIKVGYIPNNEGPMAITYMQTSKMDYPQKIDAGDFIQVKAAEGQYWFLRVNGIISDLKNEKHCLSVNVDIFSSKK